MNLKLTLIVFRGGVNQGELVVTAQYPDPIAALNAVAQLGAAHSLLSTHPDVQRVFSHLSPGSLARIHERMGGGVVQIKEIAQYTQPMPEELRISPNALHIMLSRRDRTIPPEGILTLVHEGRIH